MADKLPFEELLRVFIAPARRELQVCAGSAASLLTEGALENLETSLLRLLAGLLGQALELKFSVFRHFASVDGADVYQRFVSGLSAAGVLKALAGYPILEPLLTSVVTDWVSCCSRMLRRLERDLPEIRTVILGGQAPGKIESIQCDLSDRHNGGETVSALRSTDAPGLVYKPKNCDSDTAFCKLLSWVCHRGGPNFLIPRMLLRRDYAWMQYIPQEPCITKEQVGNYFRRAGGLLFAVYMLSGTDCHFDNLIAFGEYPVVVDTETFFQPSMRSAHETSRDPYTVFSTGLLPGIPTAGCDASGFGAQAPQRFGARIPRWLGINTGSMELRFTEASVIPQRNVPMFEDKPCRISSYSGEFLNGFEETYRLALQHRSELLGFESPLEGIQECQIRFLVRGTLDYYFALNRALHLRNLHRAQELVIQLPELSGRTSVFQSLVPAEIEALRRVDIPRFVTTAGSRSLSSEMLTVSDCFSMSGYERLMQRVRDLGLDDLKAQLALIRIALA